jgi:hypothetical protein
MAEDMTMQLLAVQQAGGRELAQVTMLRRQHEMEQAVVNVVDEVSSKAPAPASPGTGLVVDKQA